MSRPKHHNGYEGEDSSDDEVLGLCDGNRMEHGFYIRLTPGVMRQVHSQVDVIILTPGVSRPKCHNVIEGEDNICDEVLLCGAGDHTEQDYSMTQTLEVSREEIREANLITAQRYEDNGDDGSDGTSIGSGKGMSTDIDDCITLTPGVSRPEIIEAKKITLTPGVSRRGYSYGNQGDYSKGDDSSGGDVYVNDSCLLMDECNNSVVSDDSFWSKR